MIARPLAQVIGSSLAHSISGIGGGASDPLAGAILRLESDFGGLTTGAVPAQFLDPLAARLNQGTGASDATQATGLNQPTYLGLIDGEGYAYSSGVDGNGFQVSPDPDLNITQDLEIRVRLMWTRGQIYQCAVGMDDGSAKRKFDFSPEIGVTGIPGIEVFRASTGYANISADAAITLPADAMGWLAVKCSPANNTVQFLESVDGVSWDQIGSDQAFGDVTGFASNDAILEFGARSLSSVVALQAAFSRVQIFASIDGSDLRFDWDASTLTRADDYAASVVATTGQTVTAVTSGNNPASFITIPEDRYDGIQQFMGGTWDEALTGGRMFAVFQVLGDGGESVGRVFTTFKTGETDYGTPTGMAWSLRSGSDPDLLTYANGGARLTHIDGFSGKVIHEVLSNGTLASLCNNADPQTSAYDSSLLDSDNFRICSDSDGGGNTAIAVKAIFIFPPDADPEPIRAAIIAKYPLP